MDGGNCNAADGPLSRINITRSATVARKWALRNIPVVKHHGLRLLHSCYIRGRIAGARGAGELVQNLLIPRPTCLRRENIDICQHQRVNTNFPCFQVTLLLPWENR